MRLTGPDAARCSRASSAEAGRRGGAGPSPPPALAGPGVRMDHALTIARPIPGITLDKTGALAEGATGFSGDEVTLWMPTRRHRAGGPRRISDRPAP